MAADGGDEVGPEDVGSEEKVLGAGASDVGINITRVVSSGKEEGPGRVGGEEIVL